jgi:glycosyltransferase involved in cell wall biosynthesis
LHIAFLTPEFVTEYKDGGGLGNYVNKMTMALREAGHEPEVFVLSERGPETFRHGNVLVHRVYPWTRWDWLHAARGLARLRGIRQFRVPLGIYSGARELARALESRHRAFPFDAVQSTDFMASGLYVRPRPEWVHIVRASCAAEWYRDADEASVDRQWWARYELKAVKRAQVAYAPSRCVAEYYQERLGRFVHVVRPPAVVECPPEFDLDVELPKRFLLHFGQLRKRKGTEWLARALLLAWKEAPDLALVMAGQAGDFDLAAWRKKWGPYAENVMHLGPLEKPQLYALLRRAHAAVLPSIVDNLPNTVIESLSLGVPVIGTAGASIDELVEPGKTGELAPVNDDSALAVAMVRMWRGESVVKPRFSWDSVVASALRPDSAVKALLNLLDREGEQKESKLVSS